MTGFPKPRLGRELESAPLERILFPLVAGRALAPSCKPALRDERGGGGV